MFRGLINDARTAVGSAVARYTTRAAVVGLFVLALGFATAAISVQLVQVYGAINAYWMLAGGFTLVGVVAAIVVSWQEGKEEASDVAAIEADTAAVSTEAAAQAAAQLPIALLGGLLTTPLGPSSVMGLVRFAGRNLSLVIFLGLIAVLFWPDKPADANDDAGTEGNTGRDEPGEALAR